MKKLLKKSFLVACLLCVSSNLQALTTSSVTILTDYVSDGVSQTNGEFALQGFAEFNQKKVDDEQENYINLFLSNLETEDQKGYEFTFGLGTKFQLNTKVLEFGLLNNFNLSFKDVDSYFLEVYAVSYLDEMNYFTFSYADDKRTFDGGKYAKITWDQAHMIDSNFSWSYQLGFADMFRSKADESAYFWFRIGLHYDHGNVNFSLDFHDTSIGQSTDLYNMAQSRVTGSVSISF